MPGMSYDSCAMLRRVAEALPARGWKSRKLPDDASSPCANFNRTGINQAFALKQSHSRARIRRIHQRVTFKINILGYYFAHVSTFAARAYKLHRSVSNVYDKKLCSGLSG